MWGSLIEALGAAAERRLRDAVLVVAAAALMAACAIVGLGFGTFAAYVAIRSSQGSAIAALILCAVYTLLAASIGATWAVHRRAGHLRFGTAAPRPVAFPTVEPLARSPAPANTAGDQDALMAAMRLGSKASPLQLVMLAFIGGFSVGRKLRG